MLRVGVLPVLVLSVVVVPRLLEDNMLLYFLELLIVAGLCSDGCLYYFLMVYFEIE